MINHADVNIGQDGDADQFCVYYEIQCKKCQHHLGKFYLSTTQEFDHLKNLLLISSEEIVAYDIMTSQIITPIKKVNEGSFLSSSKGKEKLKDSVQKGQGSAQKGQDSVQKGKDSGQKSKDSVQKSSDHKLSTPQSVYDEDKENKSPSSVKHISFSRGGGEDDSELQKMIEVDNNFNEMKSILASFARMLERFDLRLSQSEKQMIFLNETLSNIYKELNVQEVIDLAE